MTIVMVALRMNMMKSLGGMVVGSNASPALQYAAGGAIHFTIGIVYGIIYAWLVGRVVEWNRFIKGTVYGLAIAAIAFASMPLMSAMKGGGGGGQTKSSTMNPWHLKESGGAMNPCHPTSTATSPCHPADQKAAANPCNPGGGGGVGPWSGAISVFNHLVYALALAFVYGKAR